MSERPAQRALLSTLTDREVAFVLIGGLAVAAHGYERATRDVDLVYETETENAARFAAALRSLQAEVTFADTPTPEGGINGDWLGAGGHFRFATDFGPVDALSVSAGRDYGVLSRGAVEAELADGTRVSVCGYEDLIAIKRAGGRERDREDVRQLEALHREAGGEEG